MRTKIKGNQSRPRLYVFKSNKHIYAQIIDDTKQTVLASSSSICHEIKQDTKSSTTCDIAKLVGQDIAKKSQNKGINKIIFDRGKRLYHGQIKALADGAREKGITF